MSACMSGTRGSGVLSSTCDLPLLCVAVEGSDNPVSLEKPCQASLPPDQQGRHSLGRQPEVQYIACGDVLVRGVGGVCDMCMCLTRGGVGGEGGEWMRELGLGFTNPLGTGVVLDMCLCFGCGGVGGEWVGGLDRGRERWGGVMSV